MPKKMPKKNDSNKSSLKKTKNSANLKKMPAIKKIEAQFNQKIDDLKFEIEKQKDKNIRLLAEFDNYKRRTRDEKNHLMRYSGEDIILSILPAIDDLKRTVDNVKSSDEGSIKEAINLVFVKLNKILNEKNIESFNSIGEKFDPELHEALMSEPGDSDDIVVKEFEAGYKYHDRIIRHAKVVVSKIDK